MPNQMAEANAAMDDVSVGLKIGVSSGRHPCSTSVGNKALTASSLSSLTESGGGVTVIGASPS